MKLLLTLALLSASVLVSAAEPEWLTDMDEARRIAKKENKHILVNFAGSDWCGWCKRLDREVFNKSAFKEFSEENLVLLKVDFPRKTKLPTDQAAANRALKRQYGVQGFPTIFLMTAGERIVVKTGYRRGGADKYVDFLREKIGH